jgi:hypothetical protein
MVYKVENAWAEIYEMWKSGLLNYEEAVTHQELLDAIRAA